MKELSGSITEKYNSFRIVWLEFAKKLTQKFVSIDIDYDPVRKYTEIINYFFSGKFNLAFGSTFTENSWIRHGTAF